MNIRKRVLKKYRNSNISISNQMKNVIKNIFLIIALSAVIIMAIAISLYDYIPTSTTIAEPNVYETEEETTKVLAEIAADTSLDTEDDSSGSTSGVLLKSYSITETDLALYAASSSYEKGKADPFADPTTETSTSGETTTSNSGESSTTSSSSDDSSSSSNTNSSSSSGTTSDGTLFNSTSSK